MPEDWLGRWEQGRIGWHEAAGNRGLQEHWPRLPPSSPVLVPLCGKSLDLLWLARRGLEVCGVELSQLAVEALFAEQGIDYRVDANGVLPAFRATDLPLTVYCGDYLQFTAAKPFAALFDRGALVALPEAARPGYVAHTRSLLRDGACQLLVTLEYDQAVVDGPPWAVLPDEVRDHWPDLRRVAEYRDTEAYPPKFREAGLEHIVEAVWAG